MSKICWAVTYQPSIGGAYTQVFSYENPVTQQECLLKLTQGGYKHVVNSLLSMEGFDFRFYSPGDLPKK